MVTPSALPPSHPPSDQTTVEPKSQHTADPALRPFLRPTFEPADYLNSTLPPLSLSASRDLPSNAISLAELSAQTQSLLSQLNAQTSRFSNILTQLTDEILRTGGRLAYEIEVLRGESNGLAEVLTGELREDVGRFVTGGLTLTSDEAVRGVQSETATGSRDSANVEHLRSVLDQHGVITAPEPDYVAQLRTLTLVRTRLDSVIKVFGDAMAWPLAPSEPSLTSSLISISAPVSGDEGRSREEKGREYIAQLRSEIDQLLAGEGGDAGSGLDSAVRRIEELRSLAEVWKGTAEEKARMQIVDGFSKMVEGKQNRLDQRQRSPQRVTSYGRGDLGATKTISEGGYGFVKNLQRIRGDVYLE
ncbi:hypothetical protein LTR66_001514 [Elasticomyces elasticus]|nr:hypothetical protein LTR28_003273 [Elasticomyces elasticus]KAK4999457.1 hypothetical protein LTR66_001514 [Elasticomyces elasticus]